VIGAQVGELFAMGDAERNMGPGMLLVSANVGSIFEDVSICCNRLSVLLL